MNRLACRGVVSLWLAAYLVWSAWLAPVEADAPRSAASIRPRLVPPPEDTAAALPTPPLAVERADLAAGHLLLDRPGSFPILSSRYDRFASFLAYARAMDELGARFVVIRARKIVAEWKIDTGEFREARFESAFSPRARDYTGEAALGAVALRARERFGPDAEVMMIVPRAFDAGLFGGIERALRLRGERPDAFREILASYEPTPEGAVQLRVHAALRPDGSRVPLDLRFDLRQILALGSSSNPAG